MAVDEGQAQAEGLGQAHHGVVHGGVAMGMVLADHVANGTGRFHVRLVRRVTGLVHGVQDAAMHRLQAVAHIGQGAGDDNGHGILEEGGLHLLTEKCRAHDGALAAVGALDDGAVGVGHVNHQRAGALFLGDEAGLVAVFVGVFHVFFFIKGRAGAGEFRVVVALIVGVHFLGQVQGVLLGGLYLVAVVVEFVKVISHLALLNIQEADVAGVFLDEFLAGFHLLAHKLAHHALGLHGVIDVHLQKRAGCRLHGGFPQLLGVHLTEALIALNIELAGVVVLGQGGGQRLLVVDVTLDLRAAGILLLQAEDRRLGDVDVAEVDELGHIAVEERQQEAADVRAVDVGIGHDDDAMVAGLLGVEVLADVGADRGNERADGVGGQRAVQAGTLHVQNLTAQRQDGLELAVAGLLGRTACGIALYNEDFGLGGVLAGAVGELAGHAERVEHVLATGHLASLASSLAGLQRLGGLADDALGRRGVLLQVFAEALGDGVLHQRADLGVAELRLGLALELRVMQFHGDDGGQTLAGVLAGEVRILLLQKALRAGVIVDGTRNGLLEAVHMRAALMGVDIVGEGHDGVGGIGAGPLQGHFHGAVGVLGLEVDGLVQGFLAVVQELHEVDDAAHGLENLGAGVAVGVSDALVGEDDLQAAVQEGHLAETGGQSVVVVHRGLGEDVGVGPERDRGARVLCLTDLVQLGFGLAVIEIDLVFLAIAAHLHFHLRGKGVHNGNADAMQTAGNLVAFTAEFAAGVQNGEHDLDGGDLLLGMLVHGNTAAVVLAGDGIVGMDGHLDGIAVPGQGLVHGVVDHLVNQVVQTAGAGGADVHARAFANSFKSF